MVLYIHEAYKTALRGYGDLSSNSSVLEARTNATGGEQSSSEDVKRVIYTQYVPSVVRFITNMANQIPQFLDVSTDDQRALIKGCILEIAFVHDSTHVNLTEDLWEDAKLNFSLKKESLSELGAIGEVFETFWHVLHRVSSMALTDVEVSILCALLILCPDREGLSSVRYLENLQTELAMALKCQLILNHSSEKPARAFHRLVDVITDLRGISALYLDAILGAQVDKDTARVVEGEVARALEEGKADAQMMKREAEADAARMFSEEEDLDEEADSTRGSGGLKWREGGAGETGGSRLEEDIGDDQQDSGHSVWSLKSEEKSSDDLLEVREQSAMMSYGQDTRASKYNTLSEFGVKGKQAGQKGVGETIPMDETSKASEFEGRGITFAADPRQSETHYEEACAKLRRFRIKECDSGNATEKDREINSVRILAHETGEKLKIDDTSAQAPVINSENDHCTPTGTRSNSPEKHTRKRSATFSVGCKSARKLWRLSHPGVSQRVRPASAPTASEVPLVEGTPPKRSNSFSNLIQPKKAKVPAVKVRDWAQIPANRSKSFSQGDRAISRAAWKAKTGWKKAILHEQQYDPNDSLLARCPRISALILEPETSIGQPYGAFTHPKQFDNKPPVHSVPKPSVTGYGKGKTQDYKNSPPISNAAGAPDEGVLYDGKSKQRSGLVMQLFNMGSREMSQAYGIPEKTKTNENSSQFVSDVRAREYYQEMRRDPALSSGSNFDHQRAESLRSEPNARSQMTPHSLVVDQSAGTSHDQSSMRFVDHQALNKRPRSNTWSALAADARMRRQHQVSWSENSRKSSTAYPIFQDQSICHESNETFQPHRHASFSHPTGLKNNVPERYINKPYIRHQEEHSIPSQPYFNIASTGAEARTSEAHSVISQMLPPQGTRDFRSSFRPHQDESTLLENAPGQEQSFTHRRNTLPSRPNRWRANAVRFSPLCQDTASHGSENSGIQSSLSSHASHAHTSSQSVSFAHQSACSSSDPGKVQMAPALYAQTHGIGMNVQTKSPYLSPQARQGHPTRSDTDNRFYHSGVSRTSSPGDGGQSWSSSANPHQRSASFSHGSRSNGQSHYNQRRSTYTISRKVPKPSTHMSQGPVNQMEDGVFRSQPARLAPSPSQGSLSSSSSSSLSSVWSLSSSASSSAGHASRYQQGHPSYPSSPDSGVSDLPLDMSCPTRSYVPKSLSSAMAVTSANLSAGPRETGTRDPAITDNQYNMAASSTLTSTRPAMYTNQSMTQSGHYPADVAMARSHNYSTHVGEASTIHSAHSTIPANTLAPKPSYMSKAIPSSNTVQVSPYHTTKETNQQFTPSATSAFDLTCPTTSATNNLEYAANASVKVTSISPSHEHFAGSAFTNQYKYNSAHQSHSPRMHHTLNSHKAGNTMNSPMSPMEFEPSTTRTSPKFYISPDQEVQNLSMLSGYQALRSAPPSPSGRLEHPYTSSAQSCGRRGGQHNAFVGSDKTELSSIGNCNVQSEGFSSDRRPRHHIANSDGEDTWNPPVCRPRSQTYSGRPREDRLSRSNIERLLLQAPSKSYLVQEPSQQQQQQQDSQTKDL
ncbi:nuclear hormone receptor E75 [Elysia marginata]|uniref:Nuclear hormone receptor E75 n=1 Tax=Elysia marginata TaxID=1093978 RepID=A0AAV4HY83_9GAST|nr:nuclear hormone receptor E75 [Elysia marginata]